MKNFTLLELTESLLINAEEVALVDFYPAEAPTDVEITLRCGKSLQIAGAGTVQKLREALQPNSA